MASVSCPCWTCQGRPVRMPGLACSTGLQAQGSGQMAMQSVAQGCTGTHRSSSTATADCELCLRSIVCVMQALLSARSVMKTLASRGVSPQHRLAHYSSPGDSSRIVAVHEACERLSAELRQLSRDPVLPTRSQVGQPAVPHLAALLMDIEHIWVKCCSPEDQASYSIGKAAM